MNAPIVPGARPLYRSVFISDTHLGTRGARCDFLADFLRRTSCQHLFLVGDIIDGWRLRKSWYWDEDHDEVLRQILRHARGGTEVTYIPGNHDEMFRAWLDPIARRSGDRRHPAALGSRARHRGGQAPAGHARRRIRQRGALRQVPRTARRLAYTAALTVNRWFNAVRRRLGYPYWSLSAWLKRQVKEAVKAIDRFESALADEARRRGFDGVVCGHIHHAEMREVQGVLYLNDGDWVESCTALVEHHDGRLELIDWAAVNRLSFFAPRRTAVREAA